MLFVINFSIFLNAQNNSENKAETIVNEILFSAAGESLTLRDEQIYRGVLAEIFQKNKISQFTKKTSDDFMLSRLSYKEALVFGLQGAEIKGIEAKINEAMKKKLIEYSRVKINREVLVIAKALALIEIKEAQLKEKDRFYTWFEIIKRKYQVKLKSRSVKQLEK